MKEYFAYLSGNRSSFASIDSKGGGTIMTHMDNVAYLNKYLSRFSDPNDMLTWVAHAYLEMLNLVIKDAQQHSSPSFSAKELLGWRSIRSRYRIEDRKIYPKILFMREELLRRRVYDSVIADAEQAIRSAA